MIDKIKIGKHGEKLARNFLKSKGHIILEKNWRFGKAEIDIISKCDRILVFTEVKSRCYSLKFKPRISVSRSQEAFIMEAAQRYMEKIEYGWEIRFDIITVIMGKDLGLLKIEHFQDAFFY